MTEDSIDKAIRDIECILNGDSWTDSQRPALTTRRKSAAAHLDRTIQQEVAARLQEHNAALEACQKLLNESALSRDNLREVSLAMLDQMEQAARLVDDVDFTEVANTAREALFGQSNEEVSDVEV